MTLQEIFNKAYIGVVKQGGASMVGHDCQYRRANKHTGLVRRCAVGHLISEQAYDPSSDEQAISIKTDAQGIVRRMLLRSGIELTPEVKTLLVKIQEGAHDRAAYAFSNTYEAGERQHDEQFLPEFKLLMGEIAKNFNLTIPEVTE